MESLARAAAQELAARLGLENVIQQDKLVEIVRDIVVSIAESRATKPSLESIIKNIMASEQVFLKAIASRLIEDVDSLSLEQLEFIVNNAPEIAGRAAPLLYQRAAALGAQHVIDSLRHYWLIYGNPTPITCPRCGFRAVTPNLTCMVCGAVLDEQEVKEAIGFKSMLKEFAEHADPKLVEEVLRAGFVLVNHEVNPPSMRHSLDFYVELYLTREEKELVRSIIRRRVASGEPRV
ncbi:hypothetical protein JCM10135_04140 [Stetteria hydrogenophila]